MRGHRDSWSQLQQAVTQRATRDRLRRRHEDLLAAIEEATVNLGQAQRRLEAETRDVAAYERLGLTNVLALLRDNRTESLERERLEMRLAAAACRETELLIDMLHAELDDVAARLSRTPDTDHEVDRAYAAHRVFLVASGTPAAGLISALSEEIVLLVAEAVEIAEAVDAGQQAHQELTATLRALDSMTDPLLLGAAAQVAHHIREAVQQLVRFQRELADVARYLADELGARLAPRTLALLLERVNAADSGRDRLQRARRSVERNVIAVELALTALDLRNTDNRARQDELRNRRDVLLLGPTPAPVTP